MACFSRSPVPRWGTSNPITGPGGLQEHTWLKPHTPSIRFPGTPPPNVHTHTHKLPFLKAQTLAPLARVHKLFISNVLFCCCFTFSRKLFYFFYLKEISGNRLYKYFLHFALSLSEEKMQLETIKLSAEVSGFSCIILLWLPPLGRRNTNVVASLD